MGPPGQREAATRDTAPESHPVEHHAPPPVQQQDLGRVGAITDQKVQTALDHGANLEQHMPQAVLEQRANTLIQSATAIRDSQIGNHKYTDQANTIIETARRAIATGDSSLLDRAVADVFTLNMVATAQYRGESGGTQDGKQISDSMQRGLGMFGTDQGNDRLAFSSDASRSVLDNQRAIDAPENRAERARLLGTIDRLNDPSVSMSAAEIRSAYNSVRQSVSLACARVGESEQFRNIASQMQMLLSSSSIRESMKDQLDKLQDELTKALAKLSDSKEKEDKDKTEAEIEGKIEKVVSSALESLLAEAGAPPELISALKGSGKMLESNISAVRERGRQLLQLSITFLQNKQLILSDKNLLGKLISTAKLVSDTKTDKKRANDAIASFQGILSKASVKAEALGNDRKSSLQQMSKILEGMKKDVDKLASQPLKDAVGSLYKSLQDTLKRGDISADQVRGLSQGFRYLQDSVAKLLKMPSKTKEDKENVKESAGVVANSLGSILKALNPERTNLFRFLSDEHISSTDNGYRTFLEGLNDSLSKGSSTVDDVKGKIAERFLMQGSAVADLLRGISPKLADTLFSVLNPLKGKAVTEDLAKASKGLGIAGFLKDKVLPMKEGGAKKTALSISQKALEALQSGNAEDADKEMEYARKLVDAPEDEAADMVKRYDDAEQEYKDKVTDALKFEKGALQDILPSLPKELQEGAAKAISDMEKADPADPQVGSILSRLSEIRKMAQALKTDNFELKRELTGLYAVAMKKLESGDLEAYKALMLAAEELKSNSAFEYEPGLYRKAIMDQVSAMKDPERSTEALSKLVSAIKQSLAGRLEKAKVPQEMQETVSKLQPGDDLDSLWRARTALEALGTIESSKRIPKEIRDGALRIYGRALDALASGGDPAIAGAQGLLAQRCLSADPQQMADLESLSARIGKDPEALSGMDAFIQISDQAAATAKKAKELPPGSPMAGPLGDIAKELTDIKGKLARGDSLASDDKVAMYREQVKGMLSNPAIKAKIEGRAGAILQQSPGISPEEALDKAIDEAARSTATVAERERVKGLLALRDSILKAGPKPDKELARLIQAAAKAYSEGDAEKGALFLNAADAALANPSELKNVSDIAKGCDSGSSLSTGSFRITLAQERGKYEARIDDPGAKANARAYFDLADMAAANGDMAGAGELLRMAVSYSDLASAKDSSLDKDMKKQRAEAMSSIESWLGDYRTDKTRLRDRGIEYVTAPVALAVMSKRKAGDAEGFGDMQLQGPGFEKLAFTVSHLSDFDALEAKGVIGGWEAEKKRLLSKAEQSRNQGNEALAQSYEAKASEADPASLKDEVGKGKDMLTQAAAELEKSQGLSDEAERIMAEAKTARESGKDEEAGRLEGKAKELYSEAAEARAVSDRLRFAAAALADNLKTMDLSVRKTNTINRENGRFQLGIAIRTDIAAGMGIDADSMGEPRQAPLTPDRSNRILAQARRSSDEGPAEDHEGA